MDVNPQYMEALDVELFKVIFMFEAQLPFPALRRSPLSSKICELATFPADKAAAFVVGLSEVCLNKNA